MALHTEKMALHTEKVALYVQQGGGIIGCGYFLTDSVFLNMRNLLYMTITDIQTQRMIFTNGIDLIA